MRRLTTDNPQNNYETMMNMVYSVDGWQHIRHGENGMPTTDFCLVLCQNHGCVISETITNGSQETKDEWLCDCAFEGCPIATVYAALSGFGHVRGRLKMYEDAGMMPPDDKQMHLLRWLSSTMRRLLARIAYWTRGTAAKSDGAKMDAKEEQQ